jgi:hypothetical protein
LLIFISIFGVWIS